MQIKLEPTIWDGSKVCIEFGEGDLDDPSTSKVLFDVNIDLDVAEKLAQDLIKHIAWQRAILKAEGVK
jgi:hypothetical protein